MSTYRENESGNVSNNLTTSILPGSKKETTQKFFKENYIKAVEIITPKQYLSYNEEGTDGLIRLTDQLVNTLLAATEDPSNTIPIFSPSGGGYILGDIRNSVGLEKLLIKQNEITNITPEKINSLILTPLGTPLSKFKSYDELYGYLSGTFFPSIKCAEEEDDVGLLPQGLAENGIATHKLLAKELNWIYFLNRISGYSPEPNNFTKKIINLFFNKIKENKPIILVDCVKLFLEYLYINKPSYFSVDLKTPTPAGATQAEISSVSSDDISRINTLCDIVFSPHYFDKNDLKVKTAFEMRKVSPLFRYSEKVSNNPFSRLLEAVSFSLADINNTSKELEVITNIDLCPDQLLPYLSELVGWDLIGYDPSNWRVQLKNAVEIQKIKGTKKSIQIMLDMLFRSRSILDTSGLVELWESYLPHLIMYALATDSSLFRDGFISYTPEVAQNLGLDPIKEYSFSSIEENIKMCVDRILLELALEMPSNFDSFGVEYFPRPYLHLSGQGFSRWVGDWHTSGSNYFTGRTHNEASLPLFLSNDPSIVFKYRGKTTSLPPFEEYIYYTRASITEKLVNSLKFKLRCFGVSNELSEAITQYLLSAAVRNIDIETLNFGFLVFTKEQTTPPNYNKLVKNSTNQTKLDKLKYLPLWSGKSSYFSILLNAEKINFQNNFFGASSSYAMKGISDTLKVCTPSHAIPRVFLTASAPVDYTEPVAEYSHPELSQSEQDVSRGYASIPNSFQFSSWTVHPSAITHSSIGYISNSYAKPFIPSIFSGSVIKAKRNTLRRRDKRGFIPVGGYFNRSGSNGPIRGSSGTAIGSFSSTSPTLGYIASKRKFVPVPLVSNPSSLFPMTKLLDRDLINSNSLYSIWSKCENLSSNSTFNLSGIEVDTSNTYPTRGLTIDDVSAGYILKTRDGLDPILALKHKVGCYERFLEAKYLLSSFWFSGTSFVTQSTFPPNMNIFPNTVSSWFAPSINNDYNTIQSLANYLDYADSSVPFTDKINNFMFGEKIHRLFNFYIENYVGTLSSLDINSYDDNSKTRSSIISHTFGPYINNANLYDEGEDSALITTNLDASGEKNISFGGGAGVLSDSDLYTNFNTTPITMDEGAVGFPEYINSSVVDAIGLIDTSSQNSYDDNKGVFSVYKFPITYLDEQHGSVPIWARNDLFVDSMAIKYSRPYSYGLPRIRLTINPPPNQNPPISPTSNFLLPKCKYKLKVKLISTSRDGKILGGESLGVWVHTDPLPYPTEDSTKFIWSYKDGKWSSNELLRFSGLGGINLVTNSLAMTKYIPPKNLPKVQSSQQVLPRGCKSHYDELNSIDDTNQGLKSITREMYETLEFEFDTFDNPLDPNWDNTYAVNSIHRKYHIDLMLKNANQDKFIIVDSISLENETLRDLAKIKTVYGDYSLDKYEVRTCLSYFLDLSRSGQSRNQNYSYPIMGYPNAIDNVTGGYSGGVNGGTRASYRTSTMLHENASEEVSQNNQVTIFNILE